MRRSRWLLVLSAVIVSSVLASACGGGGGEKTGTATAPAATIPAGNTPGAENTATAQGIGGQFGDLSQKFQNATFKATYEVKTSGGNEDSSGTMTLYKKGDNLRQDLEGGRLGENRIGIIITLPDRYFVCNNDPQTGGGTCISRPNSSGRGATEIVTRVQELLTNPTVTIVSTSSRDLAGEDATCYTLQSPQIEGNAEVCLNSEGVPLSSTSTTKGVETSVVATAFSRDVSDSDFEPPYPVSEATPSPPSGQ